MLRPKIAEDFQQTMSLIEQISAAALTILNRRKWRLNVPLHAFREIAMVPHLSSANVDTVNRVTQQLVWFLKTFHEEEQKNGASREAEFWR